LSRNNDVLILNRGDQISCLPLLWERAKAIPRIEYRSNTRITALSGHLDQQVFLQCLSPGEEFTLQVDILIGAIGRDPQVDFIPSHFQEKAIQLENSGDLYFIGDVTNGLFRQTAIAVGDGILAAMKINKKLEEKDW
jgi:thioredoxin reductase